jgi:hypothetical protein
MSVGYQRPLELMDIWNVNPDRNVEGLSDKFKSSLEKRRVTRLLIFVVGILIVTSRFDVKPSISGLILSYMLSIVQLIHQWVSEFVTHYWVSMYYNSRTIRKATSHYFLDCSSGQGTIIKAKWPLSSQCPSSHSTLKTSIALRIPTTAGDPFDCANLR